MEFRFRTVLSVCLCRISARLCRAFGRGGTSLPGKLALMLNQNILAELSDGIRTTLVTGTNGKTTTARFINRAFEEAGLRYFANSSGANMLPGIVTAFAEHVCLRKKRGYFRAVIECDELSLPRVCRFLKADCLVVTNLSPDQLDRCGEPENVKRRILEGIRLLPEAVLCLNRDDPLVASMAENTENRVIFWGALPPRTGLKEPDVAVTRILHTGIAHSAAVIRAYSREYRVQIGLPGRFNIANGAAAWAACAAAGIREKKIMQALEAPGQIRGRGERLLLGKCRAQVFLVKNASGLNEVIRLLIQTERPYRLVFLLNDCPADGRDIGWIWEADLESLADRPDLFAYAAVSGSRAEDMAYRLIGAGFPAEGIRVIKSCKTLLEQIGGEAAPAVFLPTYTAMNRLYRAIEKGKFLKAEALPCESTGISK